MGVCLTDNVIIQPESLNYIANSTKATLKEWPPNQHASAFIKYQDFTEERIHSIAYGVLISPNLEIPIPPHLAYPSLEGISRSIFAVMEFDAYKARFREFDRSFTEVLENEVISSNRIVQLCKNEAGIIREIRYLKGKIPIGTHKETTYGYQSMLSGIGLCTFNGDEPFFYRNTPTNFSVSLIHGAKLGLLEEEVYDQFITQFRKAHMLEDDFFEIALDEPKQAASSSTQKHSKSRNRCMIQ